MYRFPILFILNIIFTSFLFSQELPPIKNFTPLEYDGENQNWNISQASNKFIYVANNNKLLEYTGSSWNVYPSSNGSAIRAVKAKEDLIYTGAFMEFGFWKKDIYGKLNYTSLSDSLKSPMIEEEDFWNILTLEDWVIFQSLHRIYIYDSANNTFDIINARTQKAHIFLVDGTIFFQRHDKGLFKIENGEEKLVYGGSELNDVTIIGVYKIDNDLLFLNENGVFYKYNGIQLKLWEIKAKEHLKDLTLYSSYQLRDGSLILGSITNGVYHISKEGEFIHNINHRKGLNDNTILSIFEDIDNNIWLGLDNGISIINIESPFKEFIDINGLLGTVYTSKYFNGRLYLGTNHGLFVNSKKNHNEFQIIKGSEGQVWSLQELYGELFCGHNLGTFIVRDYSLEMISDFSGTWKVIKAPDDKNFLIQGHYDGISFLERVNGKWKFRNKLKGFNISSRFFELKHNNKILVNSEHKGIYQIQFDNNKRNATKVVHKLPNGYASNIFKFEGKNYYKTENGIFKFDDYTFNYQIDSTLTELAFNPENTSTSIIIPDEEMNRLWSFSNNGFMYIYRSKFKNKIKSVEISTPRFLRRNLGVNGFENITHLNDNTYLIGKYNGYLTLDLDKIQNSDFDVYLNSISKGNYSDDNELKVSLLRDNNIEYSENILKFQFSVPVFDKYTEVKYQYKLDNNKWSKWSSDPNIILNNLSFGNYELMARATIGNTLSENVINYRFTIKRPWYLSIPAILSYFLLVIILALIIDRMYKYFYHKKQTSLQKVRRIKQKIEKLEDKKEILKQKNDSLQDKIEEKSQELAVTQLSLNNKNEFLVSIRNKLKNISSEVEGLKPIIRTINKNIEQLDDKKLFEDAFNNADIDFLKKLKTQHEDLTPDDLRLCSYLRLNLSSKEIAPLLNISAKSVVMKRYRLRKKLNLEHDNSLTDYILNF